MAVLSLLVKFLRKQAAKLTATCSQMTAPCEQLQSMKCRHCAWSFWRELGQGLHMLETFPCSCYTGLLARGQVLKSARPCLFMCLVNIWTWGSSQELLRRSNWHVRWMGEKAIYCVFNLYLRSWCLANDWLIWGRWGSSPWAVSFWLLKLMSKRPARLTATCSQMNAPCK